MNVERNIKLLLLKLGRQGNDVSLIKIHKYSQTYDRVSTFYRLSFWRKVSKMKRDGSIKEVNIPDTHEFQNGIELLKYLVVKSNERAAQDIR
jgi:hypothetical protein